GKTNMFPLIQRRCFSTPFKLQKLTHNLTGEAPGLLLDRRNKAAWSSSSLRPLPSPYAAQLQPFHTSPPVLKKKTPAEPEAAAQRSLESLRDCPRPVLYLSLAGLVPFVAVPLAMALQGSYCPELASAQAAYGAATASFLGGMRWGFALPESSPAKPDWLNLANGTVPPLLACQASLFKDVTQGALMLVVALGVALHYDVSLLPTYPRWFKVLRVVGTVVMILSLLATVALKASLEGEQSDDGKIRRN
ncbi:TMM69 protein, partial [Regulus satrapa]|nr:TMM69 protein [Regulus satrapa]